MFELLQLAICLIGFPIMILFIYIPASYVEYKEIVNIKSNDFFWRNLTNLTVKMLKRKGYKIEYIYDNYYRIVKKDV